MKIPWPMPDYFVPEEKEFQIYCAIKLLKANYINKAEAIKICGFSEEKFNRMFNAFETRYKKICGDGYADFDFEEISEIAK